jgi:hypothetical protein
MYDRLHIVKHKYTGASPDCGHNWGHATVEAHMASPWDDFKMSVLIPGSPAPLFCQEVSRRPSLCPQSSAICSGLATHVSIAVCFSRNQVTTLPHLEILQWLLNPVLKRTLTSLLWLPGLIESGPSLQIWHILYSSPGSAAPLSSSLTSFIVLGIPALRVSSACYVLSPGIPSSE